MVFHAHHEALFANSRREQESSSDRKGFTLVELLVVIGIIAILISILLPTINRVRRQSQAAVCLSNIRQISQAMVMYTIDNKNFTMTNTYQGGYEQYWWQALQKYWGVKKQITVGIGTGDDDPEVRKAMKVILCPSADQVAATAVAGNGGFNGTAFTVWRHKSGGYGSYCFNMWLLPYGVYGPWGDPYTVNPPPNTPIATVGGYTSLTIDKFFMKYTQAKGDTPVVGDGWWIGSWAENTDFSVGASPAGTGPINPKPDLVFGGPDSNGYYMDRFLINRHYGAINVGFADGSRGACR